MEILYLIVGAFIAGFMFTLGQELNHIFLAPLYRKISKTVQDKWVKAEGKRIDQRPYKSTKMGFCAEKLN